MNKLLYASLFAFYITACSPSGYIRKTARRELTGNDVLKNAHTGISIYDAGKAKHLYRYQSDKYFVPASNTKIFSLYAGLKYLGDSITGIRYRETTDSLILYPAGDPTLLHPDFKRQPVIDQLKGSTKIIALDTSGWKEEIFAPGWGWDDYNSSYMPERSALPVYGNVIKWIQYQETAQPSLSFISEPEIDWPVRFIQDSSVKQFEVIRSRNENLFYIKEGKEKYKEQQVPFITNGAGSAIELLKNSIGKTIVPIASPANMASLRPIYTQHADSLFQP
ncbi:MAG: D-alanyl-D-alanine carboxypeptidase, partial [Chitinophagaceae bacterium]|nr:D-alanyl-D-alanine carboxypeptidase [Chitinophagaceae bacterium]